jgi:hypothetical protein
MTAAIQRASDSLRDEADEWTGSAAVELSARLFPRSTHSIPTSFMNAWPSLVSSRLPTLAAGCRVASVCIVARLKEIYLASVRKPESVRTLLLAEESFLCKVPEKQCQHTCYSRDARVLEEYLICSCTVCFASSPVVWT